MKYDFVEFIASGRTEGKKANFYVTCTTALQASDILKAAKVKDGTVWGVLPNGKKKLVKRVSLKEDTID